MQTYENYYFDSSFDCRVARLVTPHRCRELRMADFFRGRAKKRKKRTKKKLGVKYTVRYNRPIYTYRGTFKGLGCYFKGIWGTILGYIGTKTPIIPYFPSISLHFPLFSPTFPYFFPGTRNCEVKFFFLEKNLEKKF